MLSIGSFGRSASCEELIPYASVSVLSIPKFLRKFNFAKTVKRHICNVKNLRLGHDLHTSISKQYKDFAIVPGSVQFRENKTIVKIFEFTVTDNQQ